MKHAVLSGWLIALTVFTGAHAQSSLSTLATSSFPVMYSAGHEARAAEIALRIEQAMNYHHALLGFRPEITLLVLSEADWAANTPFDVVYGMPHYVDAGKKLILAAEDNAFWQGFFPPMDQLPPTLRQQIQSVYGGPDGRVSARPFFDLLAIHELGHAFHFQAGLHMQRKWMGELFCNIFLHTYIARQEPEQLPALTAFPAIVVGGGTSDMTYTSLQDLQDHYMELVEKMPRNYGWYQCRFHIAAVGIYDVDGPTAILNLWNALMDDKAIDTDSALADYLEERGVPGVARLIRNWEKDMIR
jgi:hypothetical protein